MDDDDWVRSYGQETAVTSPFVAPFASSGLDDDRAWVAFSAHATSSLATIWQHAKKRGGLPPNVALNIVRQVGGAIEIVHTTGQAYALPLLEEFVLLEDGRLVAVGLGDLLADEASEPVRRESFWK